MSNKYPQYPHTVFGDKDSNGIPQIDDQSRGYMSDITSDMVALAQEYQTQFTLGNTSTCAAILEANPDLETMMWKAENYNWMRDAIMAIETYYANDVQDMLNEIAANALGIRDDLDPSSESAKVNGYAIYKINQLINELKAEYTVSLTASAWTGTGPYSQTVEINGISGDKSYERFSVLNGSETVQQMKDYNKAFGFITAGTTSDNSVTMYAYKKPEISFSIMLREV